MRKKVAVVDLALDEKEIEQALGKHEDRINNLETKVEVLDTRLKNMEDQISDVKNAVVRFENNSYQNNNAILQTMSQLVINTSNNATQLATTTSNNKTKVNLKLIGVISAVVTGVVTISGLIIKAIFG